MLIFLLKTFGGTILGQFLKSLERFIASQEALKAREKLGRVEAINEVSAAAVTQKQAVEAQANKPIDTDAVTDALEQGKF